MSFAGVPHRPAGVRFGRSRSAFIMAALLASLPGVTASVAAGQDTAPDPSAVAALIEARCADCHSEGGARAAEEPRALREWSGAGSLAEVVATVVTPGDALDSDLYLSVELDDMPPDEPLSDAEKELLRTWIDAGAALPTAAPDPDPEQAAPPQDEEDPLELAGRFHPVLVHFPIALLLAAVPAWLLARLRRRGEAFDVVALYCVALGFVSAVASSAVGWCAHEAGAGRLQSDLVERHEWAGFVATGLAGLTLWAGFSARRGRRFGRFYGPLLLLSAAVVSAAGHFGGELVWGVGHLPLPF